MDLFERINQNKSIAEKDTFDQRVNDTENPGKDNSVYTPLAERMRPRTLHEVVGHTSKVGPNTPLGRAILADRCPSVVLWGPPGVGKTTVAKVIAHHSKAKFLTLSAVLAGVSEVRAAVSLAESERRANRKTVLFIDEIHRFNKSQQDALLPHIESGTVIFIGATTENPSFALNSALLSRCQVVRLDGVSEHDIAALLARVLNDKERGEGNSHIRVSDSALNLIASWADGDVRKALGLFEHLITEARTRNATELTDKDVSLAAKDRTLRYDRSGEEHYNLVSAFIKSMRGSDPDASLYWAIRMIEGGDDPLFLLRRMLIFAAEDVGLADPRAIEVVAAADHAFQRTGMPEGLIPLAQAVIYLAVAPKSKAVYRALREVQQEIAKSGALSVPMKLRNAPTKAMASWGYGQGYNDPQRTDEGYVPEHYLPEELENSKYYQPTQRGWEIRVGEHLAKLRNAKT